MAATHAASPGSGRCTSVLYCWGMAEKFHQKGTAALRGRAAVCVTASSCESRVPNPALVAAHRAAGPAHAFGHDADLFNARALRRVNDEDDVAVAERARRHDEHRLVLALVEDVAEPRFELLDRDVAVIDGDLPVGRVV